MFSRESHRPHRRMCNTVYISTNSTEDLASHNTELVRFEKVTDPQSDPCISLLAFSEQWYVGSKTGCSCTFRHLLSVELGFGAPEDWYPEEDDEINATLQLYRVLESLLVSGHQLDLLALWEGAEPKDVTTLNVSLSDVPAEAFRMFENHRFRLTKR